ncbi:MAG TPA: cytochrome d ubiquinol oxidase subunit II [Candidatus Polarisedimenticolia bacterium]|nr:cytochrome d ubiquinol oxidase subunit II [Candidatus Polarisedimenticolia bacterium]
MVELWFGIVSLTVTLYVLLDGYDLGAGALHLLVAKRDSERREVLASIGPYWDGNEVWLIATGGLVYVAFPKVLGSALSGFYLAMMLVLWTLILRGLAIEFRSHLKAPLWRQAGDVVFSVASALLVIVLGAAIGNLVRGMPIDRDGWFALALFTDFGASGEVGILDWYTVLSGLFTLVALSAHGAAYLCHKTSGPVQERARRLGRPLAAAVGMMWLAVTLATWRVSPDFLATIPKRPLAWGSALLALGGLVLLNLGLRSGRDGRAFLGSNLFLGGLLAATAAGLYPVLLRSIGDPTLSLTAHGTATAASSLRIAFAWWAIAFPLAILYYVIVARLHRGKVQVPAEGEGY